MFKTAWSFSSNGLKSSFVIGGSSERLHRFARCKTAPFEVNLNRFDPRESSHLIVIADKLAAFRDKLVGLLYFGRAARQQGPFV